MAVKRSADDMEEPCGQASSSSGDRPITRDDVEHLIRKEVKKALAEAMAAAVLRLGVAARQRKLRLSSFSAGCAVGLEMLL